MNSWQYDASWKFYVYLIGFTVMFLVLGINECRKNGCKYEQPIAQEAPKKKRFGISLEIYPKLIP
jgi:hypothetical protein